MPTEAQIRETLGDVGRAFFGGFPSLREVQLKAIPPIAEGIAVMVSSATASGKTEAVIAPLIWRLRRSIDRSDKTRIRLLAVAPTRALVTDLLRRLEGPCARFGWQVAAQTSDHSGARQRPDLLITTPESFDSMMVKGGTLKDGSPVDHLLAGVEGVFLDEAHIFDCSVRGDQVLFLLERLRRLRATAKEKGWVKSTDLQICGASATISTPGELALRLLGPGAKAISVSGGRDLEILSCQGEWIKVLSSSTPVGLLGHFTRGPTNQQVARLLVGVFRKRKGRKILLFCPSRAKCDSLGEFLSRDLPQEVDAWVGTHHGSLSRTVRSNAEKGFAGATTPAVLVATSTLEVGIDIGDVDVVGLNGPPPDVPSLLQRVGRGGRREDVTRIIPIPENQEHEAAFSGMLISAAGGNLTAEPRFRNWGVFVQQAASFIRQNSDKGRSRKALIELACGAWPGEDTAARAGEIVADLLTDGVLCEVRGRCFLGDEITNWIDDHPIALHSNIRSAPVQLLAVKDQVTGEIIGHVSEGPAHGLTNVGGQMRKVLSTRDGEITVDSPGGRRARTGEPAPARYPTVPFLITRAYAAEVARGIGLESDDAPVAVFGPTSVWFHFGGLAFERLLRLTDDMRFPRPILAGIAIEVNGDPEIGLAPFTSPAIVTETLRQVVLAARSRYSRSSFDDFFNEEQFSRIAVEALRPTSMFDFLRARRIAQCRRSSKLWQRLLSLCQ